MLENKQNADAFLKKKITNFYVTGYHLLQFIGNIFIRNSIFFYYFQIYLNIKISYYDKYV